MSEQLHPERPGDSPRSANVRRAPHPTLPWGAIAEAIGVSERALRAYRRDYVRRVEQTPSEPWGSPSLLVIGYRGRVGVARRNPNLADGPYLGCSPGLARGRSGRLVGD